MTNMVNNHRHFGEKMPDLAKLASNLLHCNISLPSLFHFVFSFLPNSVANLGTVAVLGMILSKEHFLILCFRNQ